MAVPKPKTAQEYHSDTTRLTSRMFWAPRPRSAILPGIFLSLIGGLLTTESLDFQILINAMLLFGFPSLLAALLSKPLADIFGGKTYLRRTTLLALAGLAIAVAVVGLVRGFEALYSFAIEGRWDIRYVPLFRLNVLIWGPTLWLRHLVMLSTSHYKTVKSIPSSSVQTISAYLLILVIVIPSTWDVLFAVLVFIFFLLGALILAEIANRPMRKSFGYDSLWLMGKMLDHMTERGHAAQESVEGFFSAISMPSQVHVGVLTFSSSSSYKSIVIVPSAHPGPLGHLGGSNLPLKLAEQLSDLSKAVLTPKGPCTHDQNIATMEDCRKIGDTVRPLLQEMKMSKTGTKSASATAGKATALAQFFGSSVLIVCSLAPNPTDDIDTATGHTARQEAKAAGALDAIFIDAHNCMEVGSGLTHFGSRASHDVIEASRMAVEAAKNLKVKSMRVGYAFKPYTADPDDGLGPMGIQVLVVEAGKQKTAYILFDGNNMIRGLREKILEAIRVLVDTAEVMTSDDHSVNMTMGGFNPVGMKMDQITLVEMAKELTKKAIEDLTPSESSIVTSYVHDLKIFGPESSARLTTGINLTVAVLKPTVVLSMTLAVVLSILALVLIP